EEWIGRFDTSVGCRFQQVIDLTQLPDVVMVSRAAFELLPVGIVRRECVAKACRTVARNGRFVPLHVDLATETEVESPRLLARVTDRAMVDEYFATIPASLVVRPELCDAGITCVPEKHRCRAFWPDALAADLEEVRHVFDAVTVVYVPVDRVAQVRSDTEGPLRREPDDGIVDSQPLLAEQADVQRYSRERPEDADRVLAGK